MQRGRRAHSGSPFGSQALNETNSAQRYTGLRAYTLALARKQPVEMIHSPFESSFTSPDQPTVLDIDASEADGAQIFASGQRLGPYRIEKLLGEGGMGAVYLAEQLEPLQRPVALKLIRSQLRGGLAEAYFLVERQALARMDHPAIAKVYDAGTTPQGYPFFAMEWIDGSTLSAYLGAHPLSLNGKLALFSRICKGVQHAHQKGVIHRDLKPSNILVVDIDGQPMPKIIDFGIAVGATQNSGGDMPLMQRAGTRGYMSPEQLDAKSGEIDIRSDVYALGVMLMEMLAAPALMADAAKLGIDNRGLYAALRASVGRAADTDSTCLRALGSIPVALRWVLAHAIDPDRSRRYESAQTLADDLDRYAQNYPLVAVPATRRYRLQLFAVRNRGPLFAGALIAAALIIGTTAAILSMLNARAAAVRANLEAQKARVTSGFLTDVLSGIDPEQARDMDKTLLHLVLDRAAARAGKQLADQPDVLAQIEGTIGSSYQSLSEYPRALDFTQRAYDVARKQLGPDAVPTLKLQEQLAKLQLYTGKPDQALQSIRQVVATFTRTLGANDLVTLGGVVDMVEIERELGKYADAEKRVADALPAIKRLAGNDDKLTLTALDDHAIVLTDLGRYAQAEPIFRDVIARQTKLWGADDPKTLNTMNSFAIMYLESQRFAQGAKILSDMLPICEKLYGPDHGFTLNIVSNLAGALRQQGTPEKIAESGPYYKRAYDAVRRKYGDKNQNSVIATHNYANYLLEVGDTVQATALQRQALATSQQLLGRDHAVTGEIEYGLGKALLQARHYAEAETMLLAAIKEKTKDLGSDHWRMAGYIDPLIQLYADWGKPEQAAQWQATRAKLKPKPAGSQ